MHDERTTSSSEVSSLRIFVAGATGVIGSRLLPLLTRAGHTVAGMTRTAGKAPLVRKLGAEPVVCDVYDALRTKRPYREAWESERAIAYIEGRAGIEFDPSIARSFVAMMRQWDRRVQTSMI